MNQTHRKEHTLTSPEHIKQYATLRNVAFIVFLCAHSWLFSTTITIKQDGSGDFTTIQAGIIASADGDTVLVHPGTYMENVNYSGKSITLSSLYGTTANEQYIHQTIIDGNQSGSCVKLISGEDDSTVLCGFTITNGSGSPDYSGGSKNGGGVKMKEASLTIDSCIITGNTADGGGGISAVEADVVLTNTYITCNRAIAAGGAIFMHNASTVTFDPLRLCNLYLNYAAYGSEIKKNESCPEPLHVIVDTFTVSEPDEFFNLSSTTTGGLIHDIYLSAQHAKLQPVDADLYVAPDGDDNNSGLTPDDPLATIFYALCKVQPGSNRTIHLADGTYSPTLNNQHFPLSMRSFVSLAGTSREGTILDAEYATEHILDGFSDKGYNIRNLHFINGYQWYANSSISSANFKGETGNNPITIDNCFFTECLGFAYSLGLFYVGFTISNCIYQDNLGAFVSALNQEELNVHTRFENLKIHNNHQFAPASMASDARPQFCFNMLSTPQLHVDMVNVAITENVHTQSDWSVTSSCIALCDNTYLNLVNCTLGNNSSPNTGNAIWVEDNQYSIVNIYNSIVYGNIDNQLYLDNSNPDNPVTINIHNSLLEGGLPAIVNHQPWNILLWHDDNLPADATPLWLETGEHPYMLSAESPCIDAGTLDLPVGFEMPEFDLAGNPRINGPAIDLGAYEYHDSCAVDPTVPPLPAQNRLSVYPSPFTPSAGRDAGTTIKLELVEEGAVTLELYNIRGQRVATLLDATLCKGVYQCRWDGRDAQGSPVASGCYFARLQQDARITTAKVMLLK